MLLYLIVDKEKIVWQWYEK